MKTLKVNCTGSGLVDVDELVEFQDGVKTLSDSAKAKVRASLDSEGFSVPFFVWKHGGKVWTMDGHQRTIVLREMRAEGVVVPKLPFAEIIAKTRADAKRKFLLINSRYGMFDFAALGRFIGDLDLGELDGMISIDGFDVKEIVPGPSEIEPAGEDAEPDVGEPKTEHTCPKCGYEF